MIGGSPADAATRAGAAAARRGARPVILVIAEQTGRPAQPGELGGHRRGPAARRRADAGHRRRPRGRASTPRRGAGRGRRRGRVDRDARRARRLHAGRLSSPRSPRDRRSCRPATCACRTPTRRATSRRRWPRGSTARSSPTSSAWPARDGTAALLAADVPGQAGGRSGGRGAGAAPGVVPDRRLPRRCRQARAAARRSRRRARRIDAAALRQTAEAPFQEAKAAVDLVAGRADRRRRARHQGAGAPGDGRAAGGGVRRRAGGVAADLRQRLAADGPPDRQLRSDRGAEALRRGRHLRRDPAPGRHEGLADDRRHQQGRRGADLRGGRLRHPGRSVRGRRRRSSPSSASAERPRPADDHRTWNARPSTSTSSSSALGRPAWRRRCG